MSRKLNGEGSEYTLPNGLKRWKIYVNGKEIRVYQNKNESIRSFNARVTKIKNSINEGTYIENSKETLAETLERYITQRFQDRIIIESSYIRKLETLKQIKKTCNNFINKPIQKITIEDIEDAKPNIRKYSQSCIDKIWELLNTGFKIAYSRKKINYNIMQDYTLDKPISEKETKKKESLTIDEQKKLENLLDTELRNHKYRNIVKLQLLTGMRIGEVLARSFKNYDEKNNTLLIDNTLTMDKHMKTTLGKHTKTYNKRTGIDNGKRLLKLDNMNYETKKIIKEQMSKKVTNIHGLLFWDDKNNSFISRVEINSWLKRVNDKYKITNKTLSSHVLRHTYITRLRESGVDMKIIQYLVGHVEGSSITNDIYTSISDEFIEQEMKKVATI